MIARPAVLNSRRAALARPLTRQGRAVGIVSPFGRNPEIAMSKTSRPAAAPRLDVVQPSPQRAHEMPYAPAVRIVGACDLMFISGATASPLYHRHPHVE